MNYYARWGRDQTTILSLGDHDCEPEVIVAEPNGGESDSGIDDMNTSVWTVLPSSSRSGSTEKLDEWLEELTAEDSVYAIFGGGGDGFLMGCAQRGSGVYRCPPRLLKGIEDPKLHCAALFRLREDPTAFKRWGDIDTRIYTVRLLSRAYVSIQADRVARGNMQLAHLNGLDALEIGPIRSEHRSWAELHKEHSSQESEVEKQIYKRLESDLKKIPLYDEVFGDIYGIGPSLGGYMFGLIGDIERFKTVSALWHYLGAHVVDGKHPKREKGTVFDWHPGGRRCVWLIGKQIERTSPGKSPYRAMYDQHKVDQSEKNPELKPFHIAARARLYAAKRLIRDVWVNWNKAARRARV